MPRQFQFVAVSNPTGPVPSESRKLSHSHATRNAHARERRLRMERYQRETRLSTLKQNSTVVEIPSPLVQMPGHGKDPFAALARSLSSQEYFLLDHYIRVVVPYNVVHCGLFTYPGDHQAEILQEWVGLAITDRDLLDTALLLSACRSLLRSTPGDPVWTQMALYYKHKGIQALRRALAEPVSLVTVAKAFALCFDEDASGELGTARQHLKGVFSMAELSGGPEYLGLSGLLERIYRGLVTNRNGSDTELWSLCRKRMGLPAVEGV